eukprot:6308032-Amphidinium_carterae.1
MESETVAGVEQEHMELRGDEAFLLEAQAGDGCALEREVGLQADREFVLEVVAQNGCALRHAAKELQGDMGVALQAVANDGHAL